MCIVQEHRGEYPSLWAVVESITPKIGCVPQTLLEWVKRDEVDSGIRTGVRALHDKALVPLIERGWQVYLRVYGADKVWCQMSEVALYACNRMLRTR